MQYELMVLLVFVGQIVAACFVGVVSSLFVGFLKWKGKVDDGKSFIFVALCNALGLGALALFRVLIPNYVYFYSADYNLDSFVNGAGYFVVAMMISCAMALATYKVTKDKLPVVGHSITTTLDIVRSLYGAHLGDETLTGVDFEEVDSKKVDVRDDHKLE